MTVKELRSITGLSAQKFGDRYKIPMRTIQDWEYQKRTPPVYVIELLERAVRQDFPEAFKNE